MSGPWVDDQCGTCREDASRHTWCEIERRLVCQPCGHDVDGCEEKA